VTSCLLILCLWGATTILGQGKWRPLKVDNGLLNDVSLLTAKLGWIFAPTLAGRGIIHIEVLTTNQHALDLGAANEQMPTVS
jgi:hypothetical protein